MPGLLARWLGRRRAQEALALADDGSLVLVAESYDLAAADSAVVASMLERGVALDDPLLVRHHLLLPDELAVEEAARLLAADGYGLVVTEGVAEGARSPGGSDGGPEGAAGEDGTPGGPGGGDEPLRVRASRTQLVTGLSLAQERSRMAGLAQRLGGDVVGYDVLGPAPAAAGTGPAATGR